MIDYNSGLGFGFCAIGRQLCANPRCGSLHGRLGRHHFQKTGACLETGSRSSTTISEKGVSGNGPSKSKKTRVRSGVRRNDRGRLRVARLFVETRYPPICTIKRSWESQPAAERTHLERPPNDAAGPRVQPKAVLTQVFAMAAMDEADKVPVTV